MFASTSLVSAKMQTLQTISSLNLHNFLLSIQEFFPSAVLSLFVILNTISTYIKAIKYFPDMVGPKEKRQRFKYGTRDFLKKFQF